MVNVTIELFFALFCAFLDIYLCIINIRQIKRGMKYQFYYLSSILWFSIMLAYLFNALAFALLLPILMKIGAIFGCIGALFMILKNDVLKHENFDPLKLIIIILFIAFFIFLIYLFPEDIYIDQFPNHDLTISYSTRLGVTFFCIMGLAELYYVYNCYLIYIKAPKTLKPIAFQYFVGMLISFLAVCLFATPIRMYIPGLFYLMNGFSATIIVKTYLNINLILYFFIL